MAIDRRDVLILSAVGTFAALAGGLAGVFALQSSSGAGDLLSANFTDLEGRGRRLREWQGKALLCNFWATWCAPCLEEVPLLIAAKQQLPSNGIDIVGIAVDSAANVRKFAAKLQINYALLVAGSDAPALLRRLGNRSAALPYTVALDRNGALAQRHLGALKQAELRQVLASLGR